MNIEWVSDTTWTETVLLLIAFTLSAIIGFERERQLKSAGIRTHTLVGLGSALFTLVSSYGFATVVGEGVILDPSRIAAQIVSGVGFLGAGVIFVRQNAVNGLTTAASIWMVAAIGMACGAGMPMLATIGCALHLTTVGLLTYPGRWLRSRSASRIITIRYKEEQISLHTILEMAGETGARPVVEDLRKIDRPGRKVRVEATLTYEKPLHGHERLLTRLSTTPGVVAVTRGGRLEE